MDWLPDAIFELTVLVRVLNQLSIDLFRDVLFLLFFYNFLNPLHLVSITKSSIQIISNYVVSEYCVVLCVYGFEFLLIIRLKLRDSHWPLICHLIFCNIGHFPYLLTCITPISTCLYKLIVFCVSPLVPSKIWLCNS